MSDKTVKQPSAVAKMKPPDLEAARKKAADDAAAAKKKIDEEAAAAAAAAAAAKAKADAEADPRKKAQEEAAAKKAADDAAAAKKQADDAAAAQAAKRKADDAATTQKQAADDAAAKQAKADRKEMRWEYRGTVFWIFVEVAGSVGKHLVALLAMAMSVMVTDPDNCEEYVVTYNLSTLDEAVCFYTGSYLYCFPALATVAAFMLVARDLLQKRFYYGMLKSGVVMDYKSTSPTSDPMILLMFWNFAHLFWYIGFICFILWEVSASVGGHTVEHGQQSSGQFLATSVLQDPCVHGLAAHAARHLQHSTGIGLLGLFPDPTPAPTAAPSSKMMDANAVNPEQIQDQGPCGIPVIEALPGMDQDFANHIMRKVLVTFGAIIIPGLLFTIFFYLDYNLERHLVPLSEFLDTDDDETAGLSRQSAAENLLKNLVVVGDSTMKKLVLETNAQTFSPRSRKMSESAAYALLTKVRQGPPGSPKRHLHRAFSSVDNKLSPPDPERTVYFVDSLWPANLLLSNVLVGEEAVKFRRFCLVFLAIALCATVAVMFFLFFATLSQVHLVLGGVPYAAIGAVVRGFHLLVVCYLFWRMVLTLGFHHYLTDATQT